MQIKERNNNDNERNSKDRNYLRGVMWIVLVCLISSANDAISKFCGCNMPGSEVAFFRFLFSFLSILPFVLYQNSSVKTQYSGFQMIRGGMLFVGIFLWCHGVISTSLSLATTINFATPIFVVVLANLFLKERMEKRTLFAVLLGFIGVVISCQPVLNGDNWHIIMLLLATLTFASLDVINKKLLIYQESIIVMLFYSSLYTMLLSAGLSGFDWLCNVTQEPWVLPSFPQLLILIVLGCGANLIAYCLLKAFAICDISRLQPIKYLELLFAALFGYLLFQDIPSVTTFVGAGLIITAALCITHCNIQKKV